jgi:hypothetical protein
MFRLIAPAAAIVLMLGLAACVPSPAPDAGVPPAKAAAVVESGDHMVIGGQTIVLADAETPQAGDMAGCRAEAVAAEETAIKVRALLAAARQIDVHNVAKGHRALVHVDGLDLGLTLISEHLAVRRGLVPINWCSSTRQWGNVVAHPVPVAAI